MPRKRLTVAIAVWLGAIALGLNALVPVHLAFDLARALAPAHDREAASDEDFAACLLDLLTGHHASNDNSSDDKAGHHPGCAVCNAIATLAGVVPTGKVQLPTPFPAYGPAYPAPVAVNHLPAFFDAYRSRAPPFA